MSAGRHADRVVVIAGSGAKIADVVTLVDELAVDGRVDIVVEVPAGR